MLDYFKKFLAFFAIMFCSLYYAQSSYLISFPTDPPSAMTVCNTTSKLTVQMSVALSSTTQTSGDVTIQLAPGVEYVPGSLAKTGGVAALSITENGGTPNKPVFKITKPTAFATGENITFEITRNATCASRTHLIASGTFSDSVTGIISGGTASTKATATYTVLYPVLNFTQPTTQNNAVLNTEYTRTFSVTNGGNGCAKTFYFSIDYGTGTQQTSLTVNVGGTPVTLTPTSTVGNIKYYTLTSAQLPAGQLCNGQTITFTEKYKLLQCNATTNYAVGWGCDAAPANWCDTKTGTGSASMATGVVNINTFRIETLPNYVDACTPFSVPISFTNNGSGDPKAAGAYNVKLRLGGTNLATLANFDWRYYNITGATINGTPVTVVNGTANGIASIDLNNVFTTDPDGPGVGLDDLDGDGFFDDLAGGGKTVSIVLTIKINCNYFTACQAEENGLLTYGIYADAQYNTMCDRTSVATSNKILPTGPSSSLFVNQTRSLTNTSYAPANVFGGVPFNARFSVGYGNLVNYFDGPNTRYIYEITLPSGFAVAPTPDLKWYSGRYPSTSVVPGATFSQSGNVLTVTSNTKDMGYFTINLVYTCGTSGAMQIPYKLRRLDNIATNCTTCNDQYFCSNLVLSNVICPSPCGNGGASLSLIKVERADNSLGWTDHTLATKQSRSQISAYDLAKALYLDDIEVSANGSQTATQNNLHLKFIINKLGGASDKLSAKNLVYTIKNSAGVITATGTLPASAASVVGTSSTQQVFDWNLTSILPGGTINAGDTFETKATYTVISNALPNFDQATGKSVYFYNLIGTTETRCNELVPEMYLVGATFTDSHNAGTSLTATSCNSINVGGSTNNYAYRFNASGNIYVSENRPGFKALSYEFTVPADYVLDKVQLTNTFPNTTGQTPATPTDITASLVRSGNTYTYTFPAAEYGYNIPVTNTYNLIIGVFLKPSCSTPAAGRQINTKLTYVPYYYHYKNNGPLPANVIANKDLGIAYNEITRPKVTLADQSGVIQASKPTESGIVRVASTGTTTAPYVWMAIPTKAGVNILNVTDIATGTILSPISYAGGVWFKLTDTGITSGAYKDYRVNFTYTTCTQTSFTINGGWNCAGYPTSPNEYTCSLETTSLTFNPQPATIQLQKIQEPTAPMNMCDTASFKYAVLSAGAGNAVNPKLNITIPSGLTMIPGTLQAEYPYNSGNWATVSTTTTGNTMVLDLTTLPSYPVATGLPGTSNDGGNLNNRQIGIRFDVKTDCNFQPGSQFDLAVFANSTCGAPASGNGVVTKSTPININGTQAEYLFSSTFVPNASFDNCASTVSFAVEQTLVASNPLGSSGQVQIEVPQGYQYSNITCTSAACPTYIGTVVDPNNNKTYATFSIPAGMTGGQKMTYTINFAITSTPPACGNYTIEIRTVDKKTGIVCSSTGVACPAITVVTGTTNYSYTIVKPSYSITSLKGTISGTNFTGTIGVTNTSTMASSSANPIKVRFYCADSAGNQGAYLGTYTVSGTIAAGATVTQNFNITIGNICATSRIIAAIETPENCACSTATGTFYLSCFKPGTLVAGATNPTKHGITSLGRAGSNNGNWPQVRNSAWTVLESQTKGFVVNRLTDSQVSAIPAGDLKEGMMIYNITQECLMINVDGTAAGWKCYKNPACPDQ